MARQPRLCVPGLPHLAELRAAVGAQPLATETLRWRVLAWLADAATTGAVQLHAYCLLPGSITLLLTPRTSAGLSALMQRLARRVSLAQPAGGATKKPVWGGRFRSAVIQPETWGLAATIWVDGAALRAGLDGGAQPWPWTSRGLHCGVAAAATGGAPPLQLLEAHWRLGNTPFEREAAYARQLQLGLGAGEALALERALRSGSALGDEAFLARLEADSARRVRAPPRGRPRKQPAI